MPTLDIMQRDDIGSVKVVFTVETWDFGGRVVTHWGR